MPGAARLTPHVRAQGMTPEPGERYWLGKHAERTPGRSGGCKYYCDRQNMRHVPHRAAAACTHLKLPHGT